MKIDKHFQPNPTSQTIVSTRATTYRGKIAVKDCPPHVLQPCATCTARFAPLKTWNRTADVSFLDKFLFLIFNFLGLHHKHIRALKEK